VNIYCANLAYNCTDDDLKDAFAQYGEVVSAKIITDRETRRSRGFGFVDMPSDEDALKAIEALNGEEFQGRKLVVNESRPREGGNRN
jgi:RNA recognition motif-containing protein